MDNTAAVPGYVYTDPSSESGHGLTPEQLYRIARNSATTRDENGILFSGYADRYARCADFRHEMRNLGRPAVLRYPRDNMCIDESHTKSKEDFNVLRQPAYEGPEPTPVSVPKPKPAASPIMSSLPVVVVTYL